MQKILRWERGWAPQYVGAGKVRVGVWVRRGTGTSIFGSPPTSPLQESLCTVAPVVCVYIRSNITGGSTCPFVCVFIVIGVDVRRIQSVPGLICIETAFKNRLLYFFVFVRHVHLYIIALQSVVIVVV